jgi:two-component system, chemotaxis family, chemotaxis protein CheY
MQGVQMAGTGMAGGRLLFEQRRRHNSHTDDDLSDGRDGSRPTARALVLEGDQDVAEVIRQALVEAGLHVAVATDGFDALDLTRQFLPDVIVLGDRVPQLTGAEFAWRYRQRPGRHAPIVLVTTANDVATLASQIGAAASVGKPFEVDQLLETVGRLSVASVADR